MNFLLITERIHTIEDVIYTRTHNYTLFVSGTRKSTLVSETLDHVSCGPLLTRLNSVSGVPVVTVDKKNVKTPVLSFDT